MVEQHPPGGTPPLDRRKFEYLRSLEPDAVVEAFRTAPEIGWSADGQPPAFPTADDPPYQAWPDGKGNILLRATIPTSDAGVSSPTVSIQVRAQPNGGSIVSGRFLAHPPGMELGNWTRAFVIVSGVLYCGYASFLFATSQVFPKGLFAVVPVIVYAALPKNEPAADSMHQHAAGLWSIIGRATSPQPLPGADHEGSAPHEAHRSH